MRWLLSLLVFVVLAAPVAAQTGIVRTEGRGFVTPDGAPLFLKGINLGNWLVPEGYMFKFERATAPRQIYGAFERLLGREGSADFWRRFRDTYVSEDDIRFIKEVGFNVVRVPVHYRMFIDDEGRAAGEGWALLDRLVGWARAAGIYVIVDLHAAPGGQTGINHDDGSGYPLMFYLPRERALTVKFWRAIARHYRGNPTILGYDLLNEPIAPSHDAILNSKLEPFYREVTAAIRQEDPHRIVFLAGARWSSTFSMFGPPFTDNLVYTYHSFWANPERNSIQRHLNFSARYNVPLYLGETGELTDEWNKEFRELHERHGVGWTFWTYKNLDTPSTVVSIPRPQGWEELVAFADGRTTVMPPRETILRATSQYLDGVLLKNAQIRWSYLASLGLKAAP